MKPILKFFAFISLTVALLYVSCKKEYSCEGCEEGNQPPLAHAGKDTLIILPVDSVFLDGSASTDDKKITTYQWTKLSGPDTFKIVQPAATQTMVNKLVKGVFEFELEITDAGGLFSKDTIQVNVIDQPCAQLPSIVAACDNSIRRQICAKLMPVGTVSQARPLMAVASSGNKIFFAGGQSGYGDISSRVDIYDIATNSWSTAELSVARCKIAAIAAGNKIFFAGGGYFDSGDNWHYYATIDIYDVSTDTWSIDSLKFPGLYTSATVGDKVFFTGACGWDSTNERAVSNRVDIYDLSTNNWTTASLSEARNEISSVTVNNKIYFAGGRHASRSLSSTIDIYDNVTNSWSVSSLNEPRAQILSIAVADKIYWAGGYISVNTANAHTTPTCSVEIRDVNTQNNSFAFLFQPDSWIVYAGTNAAAKDNKIAFLRLWPSADGNGEKTFDIYDIVNNSWSIGILPLGMPWASVISVNNTIYIAGGTVDGTLGSPFSNQVWKLEF